MAWHYVLLGSAKGPVNRAEIERLISKGEISPNTLVWESDTPDWRPARDCFSFRDPSTPPPIPDWPQAPRRSLRGEKPAVLSARVGAPDLYGAAPSRSLVDAISVCLTKYADFYGRASRSEYWYFTLTVIALNTLLGMIDFSLGLIVSFGLLLPVLAVSFRRLHDTDRSGWWAGIPFLLYPAAFAPILLRQALSLSFEQAMNLYLAVTVLAVGFGLLLTVFCLLPGTKGPNRFG